LSADIFGFKSALQTSPAESLSTGVNVGNDIKNYYKKNRRYCKMMLKKGEKDIPLIPYSWYY
jgi:hypothetical protein